MADARYLLDSRVLRRRFEAAAPYYDRAAVLASEVRSRLLERLDLVRLSPAAVLDAGCGTGLGAAALARRYRRSRVTALDFSTGMLERTRRNRPLGRRVQRVCADLSALPLADASQDLVFCNLALSWCDDLDRVFAEFSRVLRPGGLLSFATYGPDTLAELRQAWAGVDQHAHVNRFLDMHDVGDALLRAGLSDPVMDVEHIRVNYRDLKALFSDLRTVGGGNANTGRAPGLTTARRLHAVAESYERFRAAGHLPVTHEIVYGHAWGAEPGRRRGPSGETLVPLASLSRRGGR